MKDQTSTSVDFLIDRLINNTEFIRSVYYLVIMITGFLILRFLSVPEYEFGRSILFMSAWFVLIVLLQPPKNALMESDPFNDVGILDDERMAKQLD